LLTGKIKPGHTFEEGDIRRIDPLFQRERFASGLRVAERFRYLSQEYAKTPVQIAIAWVLAQPGVVCALTGPSTIPHLEENLGASGWSLASEDLDELGKFFANDDRQLQDEQMRSVHSILSQELSPESAFTDLVYVLEVLVEAGVASEEEVMPVFKQLLPFRNQRDLEAMGFMEQIHSEIRDRFLI
jgi:hypothetical protein